MVRALPYNDHQKGISLLWLLKLLFLLTWNNERKLLDCLIVLVNVQFLCDATYLTHYRYKISNACLKWKIANLVLNKCKRLASMSWKTVPTDFRTWLVLWDWKKTLNHAAWKDTSKIIFQPLPNTSMAFSTALIQWAQSARIQLKELRDQGYTLTMVFFFSFSK